MARFVLVHGAWHGAWCWQKVAPLLRAEGHTVDAVDLPGHGDSPAAIGCMTLETHVECLRDRAISIAKQREMWAARPCEQVLRIDTDHSPFLSRPQELAAQLLSVAG